MLSTLQFADPNPSLEWFVRDTTTQIQTSPTLTETPPAVSMPADMPSSTPCLQRTFSTYGMSEERAAGVRGGMWRQYLVNHGARQTLELVVAAFHQGYPPFLYVTAAERTLLEQAAHSQVQRRALHGSIAGILT